MYSNQHHHHCYITTTNSNKQQEIGGNAVQPTTPAVKTNAPAVTQNLSGYPVNRVDVFRSDMIAHLQQRNEELQDMDQRSLEEMKASQAREIGAMLDMVKRQQKMIEQMKLRHQERYDYRAAAMKHLQEVRKNSINQISINVTAKSCKKIYN